MSTPSAEMPRIPGTVVRHASDKQRIACQSHQGSAQVCVSAAPNAQQQTLRLALRRRAFGELLDQLEDHDHQDDDDQHSNHGVHPRRHCCHLLHGIGVAAGSWSLKIRGESVMSYPRIGRRNHARPGSRAAVLDEQNQTRERSERQPPVRTSRHALRLRMREEGSGFRARSWRAERAIKMREQPQKRTSAKRGDESVDKPDRSLSLETIRPGASCPSVAGRVPDRDVTLHGDCCSGSAA
jgi:hypothetical protein